jgi:hypothetical protein
VVDPNWWRSPISREDWERELEEAQQKRIQARIAWEEAKRAEAAIKQMRITQAEGSYNKRNWDVWRGRVLEGTTYAKLGKAYGVSTGRAGDIVQHRGMKVRAALNPGLNVQWENVPDEIREATLGVEFVFRNELALEDEKGWEQLEPTVYGSAYASPRPEWKPEWGHQDTSSAKPVPAYTVYKTLTRKEQTDEDY